jgi:hypothetical protein
MTRLIRSRTSPALIVAVVALIAALAGTAIAGPGASSSAITKSKVKKIANKQAGKQIQALLPIGSAELAVINTRTQTQTIPANGFNGTRITANCQSGERIISGGYKNGNGSQILVGESFKQGDGWEVLAYNFSGGNQSVTVEAYCLGQI